MKTESYANLLPQSRRVVISYTVKTHDGWAFDESRPKERPMSRRAAFHAILIRCDEKRIALSSLENVGTDEMSILQSFGRPFMVIEPALS